MGPQNLHQYHIVKELTQINGTSARLLAVVVATSPERELLGLAAYPAPDAPSLNAGGSLCVILHGPLAYL